MSASNASNENGFPKVRAPFPAGADEPMERWWPDQFGNPASAGWQNGLRYAFFRDQRRLVVDSAGTLTVYDTGDHDIGGVSQATEQAASIEFTSQLGSVRLGELSVVG